MTNMQNKSNDKLTNQRAMRKAIKSESNKAKQCQSKQVEWRGN